KARLLPLPNFMTPAQKEVPSPFSPTGCAVAKKSGRLARRRPRAFGKVIERREHAALLVWNVRQSEAHLDAGEGAREHQIIEVAEVPDPEYFPCELSEPGPERHI